MAISKIQTLDLFVRASANMDALKKMYSEHPDVYTSNMGWIPKYVSDFEDYRSGVLHKAEADNFEKDFAAGQQYLTDSAKFVAQAQQVGFVGPPEPTDGGNGMDMSTIALGLGLAAAAVLLWKFKS